jgi:hypothetical protein
LDLTLHSQAVVVRRLQIALDLTLHSQSDSRGRNG